MDIAQGVQGRGPDDNVAVGAVQHESLPAAGDSDLVVSAYGVMPAKVAERVSFAHLVTDAPVHSQGPAHRRGRVTVPSLLVRHPAKIKIGARTGGPVIEVLEQGQRAAEMLAGLVVTSERDFRATQQAVSMRLAQDVTSFPGRGQRGLLGCPPVVPVSPPVKEVGERPGDLPGLDRQIEIRGQGHGRQQDAVLHVETRPARPPGSTGAQASHLPSGGPV